MTAKPVHCFTRGNWSVGVIFGEMEKLFRWTNGDWFAVVDFNRMDAAKAILHDNPADDSGVIEQLTVDADCGGIADCSDAEVCVKAGLIPAESEDDETLDLAAYREQRALEYAHQMSSGVFRN